jgi:hypothetical protein
VDGDFAYIASESYHHGVLVFDLTSLRQLEATSDTTLQLRSRTTYDGAGYVHQGWLTEDQGTFLLGDEGDVEDGEATRTMIFDVTDLDDIRLINRFEHNTVVIGHNLYTLDGPAYMSSYEAAFNGTWSNSPFFASGTVAVSGIGEGLFLLRVQDDVRATYAD